MAYFSDFQYHQPLYRKSEDDDLPMMSRGGQVHNMQYTPQLSYPCNIHQGIFNAGYTQPIGSRCLDDEPVEISEREELERGRLERLLREAIERTERQSRELDELSAWAIGTHAETPSEPITIADEHENAVEVNGINDFDSNNYIANSFSDHFQDELYYGTDEEREENEVSKYSAVTAEEALQELHRLELEATGYSDWEDSDDEEEEEDIGNELEKVAETVHNNDSEIVLENHSLKFDCPTRDEELKLLIDFGDEDLYMLKAGKAEAMTEEELLVSIESSVDESLVDNKDAKTLNVHDCMRVDDSLQASPTSLKCNSLLCEDGYKFVGEPKPLDDQSEMLSGSGFVCETRKLNIVHKSEKKLFGEDEEQDVERNLPPDKFPTIYLSSEKCGREGDPGNEDVVDFKSLEFTCGGIPNRYWVCVLLINTPRKDKWRVDIHFMTLYWERFSWNNMRIENFLPFEYDWKGGGIVKLDPP